MVEENHVIEGRTIGALRSQPAADCISQEQRQLAQQKMLPLTTTNVWGTEPFPNAPKGATIDDLLKATIDEPGEPYVRNAILSTRSALATQSHTSPPPAFLSATDEPWRSDRFVHLDEKPVARHVGRGHYVTFDSKDFRGIALPELDPSLRIDAHSRLEQTHHREYALPGGR